MDLIDAIIGLVEDNGCTQAECILRLAELAAIESAMQTNDLEQWTEQVKHRKKDLAAKLFKAINPRPA